MAQKFNKSGRYRNSIVLTYDGEINDNIQYLSRRFILNNDTQKPLGTQIVQPGDRPDLVAFRAYGDSLEYYRIADYNLSMNPFELTITSGRLLTIPEKTT